MLRNFVTFELSAILGNVEPKALAAATFIALLVVGSTLGALKARSRKAVLTTVKTRSRKTVIGALVIALGAAYWAWNADILPGFRQPLQVGRVISGMDTNANGIDDYQDIVDGARLQVAFRPRYKSAYYDGGYPPDNEGVCTDLVWRALWNAGYDLKASVDLDIAWATDKYPRVAGSADPNIDFRRVPNLYVFLTRKANAMTTEVKSWDPANAKEWQPGDIVVFGSSYDHIGIVSDKRRRDGLPLVIHHGWGRPVEDNALGRAKNQVTGHFRLNLNKLSTH